MSAMWENLGSQGEKTALAFFNSLDLSDAVVATDGENIRSHLLGCYENFSSSQLVQAKVFELLSVLVRKSKRQLFAEENLVLALHYAKNMISEWTSSSDVTVNVLKFLTVLFEKEKPGAVDEELIAQCGEILKSHADSPEIQKICLTFICSALKYCKVESFADSSISGLAHPVVDTIRTCNDDSDIIIKSLVVLSFLFERVPEHLHAASMDALDAVGSLLQKQSDNMVLISMAVEFLQLCAVEDTHFIILSSTDKGMGLYCDLCITFSENHSYNSLLACVVLLKRACAEKVQEITVNSMPGLKKKIITTAGSIRDSAAANSVDASDDNGATLRQVVLACDGILEALGNSSVLTRSVSMAVEDSPRKPPTLPRTGSAPLMKRPAAERPVEKEEPLTSVSLLAHATTMPSSKKLKARRRRREGSGGLDESESSAVSGSVNAGTPSGTPAGTPRIKGDGPAPVNSFKDILAASSPEDKKSKPNLKVSTKLEDLDYENCVTVADAPEPYKASPDNVPRLDITKPADITPEESSVPKKSPTPKDPLIDKFKTFQNAVSRSNSNTPKGDVGLVHSFSKSKLMSDEWESASKTDEQAQIDDLRKQLNEALAKNEALQKNINEERELQAERMLDLNAVHMECEELKEKLREVENSIESERAQLAQDQEKMVQDLNNLKEERDQTRDALVSLEAALNKVTAEAAVANETTSEEITQLLQEKDALHTELEAMKAAAAFKSLSDKEADADTAGELDTLKRKNKELQLQLNEMALNMKNAQEAESEKEASVFAEIDRLTSENREKVSQLNELQTKLDEAAATRAQLEEGNKNTAKLQEISKKSQEQATLAVHRVEELHSVLTEATNKIESLIKENSELQSSLDDALQREQALVLEQEELIEAYRVDNNDLSVSDSVTLVGDDDQRIVVPIGDAIMMSSELDDFQANADSQAVEGDHQQGMEELDYEQDDYYDNRDQEDDSYYHNASMRVPKKTPAQSAASGIQSALSFLHVAPKEDLESDDFAALIEDLAELSQQYFQLIVKCPTSDPAKSINHALRATALCAALCIPQLGLVDNRKLMRSDVEISIKRQKGVRLFTVYGVAFTLVLCIHKKHKLDMKDNDPATLLFRLIELLTEYVERDQQENENIWIQSSINQQSVDSPTRKNGNPKESSGDFLEEDNGEEVEKI